MSVQPRPIRFPVFSFQPDEEPGYAVAIGLALQYCVLTLGTHRSHRRDRGCGTAAGSELFLSWAACAALMVSGITTMVQARRVGRLGAGYILLMGTSGAFIAVSVTALAEGGPGMLATTRRDLGALPSSCSRRVCRCSDASSRRPSREP